MKKSFETTGYTIKEETVDFLHHNILPNTFVIDVNHQFPGYYSTPVMDETKPRSILLVTKKKYSWEKILRTFQLIDKYTDFNVNGTYAGVSFGNNYFDCIQVKGLESYDKIPIIQHAFQEEGIRFMSSKNYKDQMTVSIKLSKFYKIEEVGENIYKDMDVQNIHYFIIPNHLNWELFRNITMKIKNNISNRNYDAVVGVFFMDKSIKDMIRIYKPNIKTELLKEIKEKYYAEIKRYF
jgi:hypothetical protein